jgi:hypothetical protein
MREIDVEVLAALRASVGDALHGRLLHHAEGPLRRLVRERQPQRPELVRVSHRVDVYSNELRFRAELRTGPDVYWVIPLERLLHDYGRAWDFDGGRFSRDCVELYTRIWECEAPAWLRAPAVPQCAPIRRPGTEYVATIHPLEYGHRVELTMDPAAEARGAAALERLAAVTERWIVEHMAIPPQMLQPRDLTAADVDRAWAELTLAGSRRVPDPESARARRAAERRGMDLLKEWLSQRQRDDLKRHGSFEVVGSGGSRFRIHAFATFNVELLDGRGGTVDFYCFVPEGNLVLGDQMLAQKIALETDERAALAVANRRGYGMSNAFIDWVDLRPGAVNVVCERGLAADWIAP